MNDAERPHRVREPRRASSCSAPARAEELLARRARTRSWPASPSTTSTARPLALEDLPSERLLAGEPRPRAAAGAQRRARDRRGALAAAPLLGAARATTGSVLRVVNVIEDVTEVKRAEWAQRLLAEASEALASSMDPARAARRARRRRSCPALAAARRRRAARRARRPRRRVAAAGVAAPPAASELRRAAAAPAPRRSGRSALAPPSRGGRFERRERELAEEIGRRAGVAVHNARSHSRRTAIARALQHGLLPPELPEVPGWSAAVLYRPAGEFNEVGGDFYDIFAGPAAGWS